jgi:hypothetical protein
MSITTFGRHEPVAQYGQRLGAVVEVQSSWVPVCMHKTCHRRLHARRSKPEATAALRTHWADRHTLRKRAA